MINVEKVLRPSLLRMGLSLKLNCLLELFLPTRPHPFDSPPSPHTFLAVFSLCQNKGAVKLRI